MSLLDWMTEDAGAGISVLNCASCGTQLREGEPGPRCVRCAWGASGEPRSPWLAVASAADPRAVLGSYEPRTTPYAHQLSALDAMRSRRAFALFMEMGTGKTKVAIDDWSMRVESGELRDLVVVAPKGVYRNWEERRSDGEPGELGLHMPQRLLDRAHVRTWGQRHSRRLRCGELLQPRIAGDPQRLRILLVNVEALSTVDDAEHLATEILRRGRGALIVDESTRVRNPEAARTVTCLRLASYAVVKRIMSGLSTPRSPLDLYSQMELLDWRILGFRSYYAFRQTYAIMRKVAPISHYDEDGNPVRGREQKYVVGYRNVEELRDRVAPHSFRVLKEQCLDLPPKVYESVDVDLHPEQLRIYESLRRTAQAALAGGTYVTITHRLTMLIRLQQVLCGYVVDEAGQEQSVPSNRLDRLLEVLDDLDGKAIIWAPHVRPLREIYAALLRLGGRDSVVRFWGEVRDDERQAAVDRFQRDDRVRWFVGNQQTAGLGITLTAASTVIYYANSPDLELRLQSEDRAHRAGLDHRVTYLDLRARGTVDDRWIVTLRRKLNLASVVQGDGFREWLE